MVGGYMGRYLFVGLTRGRITEQKLDYSLARKFLGGYGPAAHLLFEKISKGADPLHKVMDWDSKTGRLSAAGQPGPGAAGRGHRTMKRRAGGRARRML